MHLLPIKTCNRQADYMILCLNTCQSLEKCNIKIMKYEKRNEASSLVTMSLDCLPKTVDLLNKLFQEYLFAFS